MKSKPHLVQVVELLQSIQKSGHILHGELPPGEV